MGSSTASPPPPARRPRSTAGSAPPHLQLAYPGIWLRDDVYATHGHYMDCHLSLPRAECVAAAAAMRSRPLPSPAAPADYERVMRPIYGFAFGRAQSRRAARLTAAVDRPSEMAWKLLGAAPNGAGAGRRVAGGALRAGVPAAIWRLNRLLHSDFDPDFSPQAILRSGLAAAGEMAARLGVDSAHVLTGHTHRGGPGEGEGEWPLPGGGRLHNTGSWVFATAFHHPGTPPSPYWPGTVTWVAGRWRTATSSAAAGALARGDDPGRRPQPVCSHSAMTRPISSPASSWRKCPAFSIFRGGA